jgi:hypothetical protein
MPTAVYSSVGDPWSVERCQTLFLALAIDALRLLHGHVFFDA